MLNFYMCISVQLAYVFISERQAGVCSSYDISLFVFGYAVRMIVVDRKYIHLKQIS